MKITQIEDVYTVPKTENDWNRLPSDRENWCRNEGVVFGNIPYNKQHRKGKKEVPFDRFLDLLGDKITPWRLLEVGFESINGKFPYYSLRDKKIELSWSEKTKHSGVALEIGDEAIWLDITTFTELLQMMKFLGWKNGWNENN